MRNMTEEEWRAFVLEGTRTGKVAVVRPDGRPHVTPVWITLDGDDLAFTTYHKGVKARALRENPHIAICVEDDDPPFSFVSIEGEATLVDDPAESRRIATIVGGRYMGAGRAEEFGARNGVPGEYVVRVAIKKVVAQADLADW
ncbi:MAG: TIGR03618 family F420-dependent PPOX class oxidoreductase [Streptosporangiales bacterium]|nr:TIGR03618 family F420-dependent PPOX class oxidoreductase [Streptosporangiales bacterium]